MSEVPKHDPELAKRLYRRESGETVKQSPPLNDPRRRKIMIALWERMGQWFGPRWENTFGTIDEQTIWSWHGALNRFSEDEIAGAMRQMEDWESPHPPNFPEFKALCMAARSKARKNFTDKRMEVEQDAGIDVPMIEHLARHANSEVAQRELDRMRRIIAGEEVETKEESMRKLELQWR